MNKKIIELLTELAKTQANIDNEDYNTYDYSGGNYDDAYYQGVEDGEILLARKLLKMWVKNEQPN
jgi:hypothetical protein